MSISIIIPVYDVEPYIRRCLQSVMAQDKAEAHLECIIVDDCGHDGSMEIVREMIAEYDGPVSFFVLQHEQNKGLSAARNAGLAKAAGDYILFVDSDDYLMPESIQYFLDNQRAHPEADMLIGNVKNSKECRLLNQNCQEPLLLGDPNVFFQDVLRHRIYLYAWNKLIRRSVLTSHRILFDESIIFEDQLWSYQLFPCLSSVLLLPQITYVYEYNANSIVNSPITPEKANKILWSYSVSCNKMLDAPPVPERYKQNVTVDYLLFMANFLINGVDVQSRCAVTKETARRFLAVRLRLLLRSLRYGRLLTAAFFLLLFPPLSHLRKFRLFRHHYYDIELATNYLAHLTDFLHRKNHL